MTNVVTFPIKYAVITTSYDDRLVDHYLEKFAETCEEHELKPLGVFWNTYPNGPKTRVQVSISDDWKLTCTTDGEITHDRFNPLEKPLEKVKVDTSLNSERWKKFNAVVDQAAVLGLLTGVVFEADSLNEALELGSNLRDCDHCATFDHIQLQLLRNSSGDVDVAVVTVDAESG